MRHYRSHLRWVMRQLIPWLPPVQNMLWPTIRDSADCESPETQIRDQKAVGHTGCIDLIGEHEVAQRDFFISYRTCTWRLCTFAKSILLVRNFVAIIAISMTRSTLLVYKDATVERLCAQSPTAFDVRRCILSVEPTSGTFCLVHNCHKHMLDKPRSYDEVHGLRVATRSFIMPTCHNNVRAL